MIFAIFLSHLNIQRSSKDLLGPQQKKGCLKRSKKIHFFWPMHEMLGVLNGCLVRTQLPYEQVFFWYSRGNSYVNPVGQKTRFNWMGDQQATSKIPWYIIYHPNKEKILRKKQKTTTSLLGKSMFTLSRFKQPHPYLGSNLNIPSGKLTGRWLEYLPFSIRNTSSSFRVHFSASELLVLPEYHRHPPQTPKTW